MVDTLKVVAVAFSLAFLSESLVEYLFGQFFDHFEKLSKFKWALMYIAAGVGVGLAYYYKLDLIALISDDEITSVGQLLSGLVIGRGANYLHQFISNYLPSKS